MQECKFVDLPKITDPRGNLTFIQGDGLFPLPIKRVFYLYDVPVGADRGGHALKACHQMLIAIAGSFDVVIDDVVEKRRFHLDAPHRGLYLPPMFWREMDNFSPGTVCLAIASEYYSEGDYYRHYPDFLNAIKSLR